MGIERKKRTIKRTLKKYLNKEQIDEVMEAINDYEDTILLKVKRVFSMPFYKQDKHNKEKEG